MKNEASTIAMDDLIVVIRENLNTGEPIDAETPLISSGLIDSFDIVTLLSAFESRYGVAIPPEEIDVEHFDTPHQILEKLNGVRG